MSDAGTAETAASAPRTVAEPAPPLAAFRPFARPTPTGAARAASAARPTPFVAPPEQHVALPDVPANREASADTATAAGDRSLEAAASGSPRADEGPAGMIWPGSPELHAALALDAAARRLRAGSLRLPVVIDTAHAPAVLAAVLAALHAESCAGAVERRSAGSAA